LTAGVGKALALMSVGDELGVECAVSIHLVALLKRVLTSLELLSF
jgi:hypothetical protein